jgi:hypothetical protein
MNTPVTDEAVAEYARRLRESIPLGKVFPTRLMKDFRAPQGGYADGQIEANLE